MERMSILHTAWLEESIGYSGKELAAHWISQRTGHYQNSIVAFRGPTSVRSQEMVDLEDRRKNLHIEAKEMLHFLGEWFDGDLNLAITRQRLLIARTSFSGAATIFFFWMRTVPSRPSFRFRS
jgi:hypothetical protein